MEQLLAATQAELVSKERRLESVEAELLLEKGLREEFEAPLFIHHSKFEISSSEADTSPLVP